MGSKRDEMISRSQRPHTQTYLLKHTYTRLTPRRKRTHVSPREARSASQVTTSISRSPSQSISVHLSLKVSPQHVCLEAYQTILLPLSPDYLGRGGRNRREGGTVRREGRGRTDRMPEPRSSTTAVPTLSMQHAHDPAAQMQPKAA